MIKNNKEYKTCEEIFEALKNGKKLCKKREFNGYYFENKNGKIISTEIEYWYCNPQMNRMFSKLVDGRVVDNEISILDVFFGTTYVEYKPKLKKITIEEIESKGYKIEIV